MSIGSKSRRSAAGRALVALLVLMVAALPGAVPLGAEEPSLQVASEMISGTFLRMVPNIPYDRAVLRVVGPEGYALTRSIEAGQTLGLDLLDEAQAFGTEASLSQSGDRAPAPAALPDGQYHWELVMISGDDATATADGTFFVQGGTAVGTAAPVEPLLGAEVLERGDPQPTQLATHANNFFQIRGDPPSPTSLTQLQLWGANNLVANDWRLRNSAAQGSRFEIVEGTTTIRAVMLQGGNFGLGTATPTAPLEIGATFPGIQMNNGGGQWRLSAFSDPAFGVRNTANSTHPFVMHPTAPQDAMRITGDGIGLGLSPSNILAGLHVRGNAFDSPTTVIVERTDGAVANIRFRSTGGGGPTQNWLFQNNPANLVFAIRDESGGTSPFRIFGGSPENNFVVRGARWGLNVANPAHPIDTSTGARLTAGGVWQNASSRTLKDGIETLSVTEALETLLGLEPIKYTYKADPEERHVGFIAEDVPALVASADRLGLSSMDIVAVLTRVAQEQHGLVQDLRGTVEVQQSEIERLRGQQDELAVLRARLAALEALLLEAGEARLASGSAR